MSNKPTRKTDPDRPGHGEAEQEAQLSIPRAIVSSHHLASEEGWQLSEFEYALTVSFNAFSRWMVRCMSAAGEKEFNPLDILVLHNINHRGRQKRLADVCFMLNIEDTHTVNYAVKKLVRAGLVEGEKHGKEIFYSTTEAGIALCRTYREIRENCLVSSMKNMGLDAREISRVASMMRSLSGIYDQASRAAASF